MVLCVVVEYVVGIWRLGSNGTCIRVEWTVLGLCHLLGAGTVVVPMENGR